MEQYNISASIVVYNKPEDALQTVASIQKYTQGLDFSLHIIDNHSAQNIGQILKEQFEAQYILLEKNVGFGKGHNLVLDQLHSKYHFVINPDILIHEDTITNLCRFMDENPEVAIACPKVLNPDGTVQYIAKKKPGLLSLISRRVPFKALKKVEDEYLMRSHDPNQAIEVDFCTGCFFVIRTSIFKEIGGFDPDYFLYFEDADITMKAKKYGKAFYAPCASVTHFWHRETASSKRQFLIQLKSMFIYFKKWGFQFK